MADPLKVITSGLQDPRTATKGHRHDINLTGVVDPLMARILDHEARLAALEGTAEPPPPVDPDPVPPPEVPVRTIPAGSHGNITINVPGLWLFEPGNVVKGVITVAAAGVTARGFRTTSEQSHETPVILQKGSSGILEDYVIEHIGTPANGRGYSSISGNDGGQGVGWAGPWTFRRFVQDQRTFDWFGCETWGIKSLVIEDGKFRGEGVPVSIPRSDGAIVRRNDFDLTKVGWAAIELADIEDAQVIDNVAYGANQRGTWTAFVQLHPGSGAVKRVTIKGNQLRDYQALVNAAGDGHVIENNCLTNVPRIQNGSFSGPVTMSGNGPC